MNEKIRPEHLERSAYVYVRQSTAQQVLHHREGQQRQYHLAQRAEQLGFKHVVTIDEDLGRSGSGLQDRPGFGRLLAAVCQGSVGAVLALEASRLARNNRDWHHLVDLCALTNALIIDADGIYDPKQINDRLLLGLKGTMSEFELGLLRQRARQAYLQKVKRGCALWEVPVGFVRSEEGQIEKTPDRQVQQAIEMVFRKFRELGSVRQTLLWLREEHILLPRTKPRTREKEVLWELATLSRVQQILSNPCYAGAFVYGRTVTKTVVKDGRMRACSSRDYKSLAECEVLIQDHHPGYITWSDYLANRQHMANNLANRAGQPGGAAKSGPALLSGLLRCGRCGRKLRVGYTGKNGQVGRYLCMGDRQERGSAACMGVGNVRLDQAVVIEVLQAIAPAGVEAALQINEQAQVVDRDKQEALRLALERARYEADRIKRQYNAVEPENRLVAGELEKRWNVALQQVTELEARQQNVAVQAVTITEAQKNKLIEMGNDLPNLWDDARTSLELKKQILRTVIQEIVINPVEEPAEYHLQVHWAGGVHTELRVPRNKSGMNRFSADDKLIELVAELAKVCDDENIATVLNRLGYRTGQGNAWRVSRVNGFRHTHGIAAFTKRDGWLTLQETVQALQLSECTVRKLIDRGILAAKQVVRFAPWVIEVKALEHPAVQAAVRAIKAGNHVPSAVQNQPELTL